MSQYRSEDAFRAAYGPWALVTGAAQGIGRAFAEGLARRGLDLYLLDVQADATETAAREISEAFPVEARALAVDLSDRGFLTEVAQATAGSEIGLIVCNAALGQEGLFLEETADDLVRAIDINCAATVALTHHFAGPMVSRGRGGVLLVSSGTALHGSPTYSNYAATKAFNLVLGESLWHELHPRGVDVLAFVPGPTNTPGLRSSIPTLREGETLGKIELPETTAEVALTALGRGPSAAREDEHQQILDERARRGADFAESMRRS